MLTAVIGVMLSIGVFVAVAHWRARVAEQTFMDRAKSDLQAMNVHLSNVDGVLHTLKAYFEASQASHQREQNMKLSRQT